MSIGINWGMIKTGECFEALMHSLVFAEDNKARLMDRPGKDKAVDALSGNGLTVYQAKFGAQMTMDAVISLAESEMEKIKGHIESNDITWSKVKRWVLYTNITSNTWDVEKWEAFRTKVRNVVGVDAECRGIAYINQVLIDHPAIKQAFFEKENRCLLYTQETYVKLDEQSFKGSFFKTPKLVGRSVELSQLKEQLKKPEVRVVVVGGGSSVGKTRFLYEAMVELGLGGARVYWGLAESMLHSDSWFDCVNLGDESIIFVDDCEKEELIKIVFDQMAGSGAERIKFVLGINDISRKLLDARLRRVSGVQRVNLKPLTEDQMSEVAKSYQGICLSPDRIGGIVRLSGGYPGWATFVLAALSEGDHPSVMHIAEDVLERGLESVPVGRRDLSRLLLRWIALWGSIDLDDASIEVRDFLAGIGLGEDVLLDMCRYLASAGLVVHSQINPRKFFIFNRIVRNEILLSWLLDLDAYEVSHILYVSAHGKQLIKQIVEGKVPLLDKALATLSSMSATHLPGRDAEKLLRPILAGVIAELKSMSNITTLHEGRALHLSEIIGGCDPCQALEVLKFVASTRGCDSVVDGWGGFTITYDSLKPQLISTANKIADDLEDYEIARSYFEFLVSLWAEEESRHNIKNLITTSRRNNPFRKVARDFVMSSIDRLPNDECIQEVASYLLTLELSRVYTAWSGKVVFERARVSEGTELWAYREELREALWGRLASEASSEKRAVYWKLLSKEHGALCFASFDCARNGASEGIDGYRKIIKADMESLYSYYLSRSAAISIDEIVSMRQIWERHLHFSEESADIAGLARQCEDLYKKATQYNIQDLYSDDSNSEIVSNELQKTVGLFLESGNTEFYKSYFKNAAEFLKASSGDAGYDYGRTEELAYECFKQGVSLKDFNAETTLKVYCNEVLQEFNSQGALDKEFVSCLVRLSIRDMKSVAIFDETIYREYIDRLMALCRSESNGAELWRMVFQRGNEKATGKLLEFEFEKLQALSSSLDSCESVRLAPPYYGVCGEKVLSWLRAMIESACDVGKAERLVEIALFGFYVACFQETINVDRELLNWFFDLVLDKKVRINLFYSHHFSAIVKASGYKFSISQLKTLFESGLSFDYGTDVHKFFEADDKDTFTDLCEWVVKTGFNPFLRRYSLPQFLARLEGDKHWISEFVLKQIAKTGGRVDDMINLAVFAGCWANTSDKWLEVARPLCDAVSLADETSRMRVYAGLNPRMFTWGGAVDEISPALIRRLQNAQENLKKLPRSDSLRGYWEFEASEAQRMIDLEQANIAGFQDE